MFLYENEAGSVLKVTEGGNWEIDFKRDELKITKIHVKWDKIPKDWIIFWQEVCKSIFERNKPDTVKNIVNAANRFHEWLGKDFNYQLKKLEQLNELDLAFFDEYMDKTAGIKKNSRRVFFSYLITGFEEAMVLGRKEVTNRFLLAIRSVRKSRFKNINKETYESNSESVLSLEYLEKVHEALIDEYQDCQNYVNEKEAMKSKETPDMACIAAIWLGMKHGIRATELLRLKTTDIIPDNENGHHQIHCIGGKSKPERYVQINQATLDIINFYIHWSELGRKEIGSNALFIEWVKDKEKKEKPRPLTNYSLVAKINKFAEKHNLYDEIGTPLDLDLRNLRRTFGAVIAANTKNREVARQVMGHSDVQTTERHYTAQKMADLSHNVSKALKMYSLELAMSYKKPVIDIKAELPHIGKLLEENPERDFQYGVCKVPKTTPKLKNSCTRAATCLECEHLIPEARKLTNYINEREYWVKKVDETNDDRVKQQRLRRIQMLEGYIYLIETSLKKQEGKLATKKSSYKKKSYKKKKRGIVD